MLRAPGAQRYNSGPQTPVGDATSTPPTHPVEADEMLGQATPAGEIWPGSRRGMGAAILLSPQSDLGIDSFLLKDVMLSCLPLRGVKKLN